MRHDVYLRFVSESFAGECTVSSERVEVEETYQKAERTVSMTCSELLREPFQARVPSCMSEPTRGSDPHWQSESS